MVVWSAQKFASFYEDAAHDVMHVLGIEGWQWWEGTNRQLYSGVPMTFDRPERGGYSAIVVQPISDADQKNFGSPERSLRYHLELELDDWLPLLLLNEAARVLGDEAGVLRERLSRRANPRLGWLWSFGFSPLVGELSDLQYRLERLRQAVQMDAGRHAFQQFPMMALRSELRTNTQPTPQIRMVARIARWLRTATAIPKPPAQPYNLRQASIDGLNRLTREGLQDVRLSIQRARLLAEIRSTNVLLGLTAVLIVLTLILVVRAFN
jgi:hypothetical protein